MVQSSSTPPGSPVDGGFWGRPDRSTLLTFAWVGLAAAAWFVLIFGGTELITLHRALRVPVHFEAERQIPLVPLAVWIYMTMYALFLMAPFVLRSPRRLVALGATHAAIVLVAGIGFLLVPAEIDYPSAVGSFDPGVTTTLYRFADWLNLDYNLFPSLHVALTVSCVAVFAPRANRAGKLMLWSWAIAVALSTILTHFHHVLDAVGGFILGLAGARVVYARMAGSEAGPYTLR